MTLLDDLDTFITDATDLLEALPERVETLAGGGLEKQLIEGVTQAGTQFEVLLTTMNALSTPIDQLLAALDPADKDTLAEWQDALQQFGISLTVASEGLGAGDTGWSREDNGRAIRAERAYEAVRRIINRTAIEFAGGSAPNDEHKLRAILLFIAVFAGTSLQLTLERSSGSTPYAETQNPGGSIMFLYTEPDVTRLQEDINRGWVAHIPENITHEFGHVLVFRNDSDNSEIFRQWYVSWDGNPSSVGIGQYISTPFPATEGWGVNAANLQNIADLSGSELENERLANMFEAWATGYSPDLDSTELRQRRVAWALWTFMTAQEPPSDVCIDATCSVRPVGSGFMYWLQLYGI